MKIVLKLISLVKTKYKSNDPIFGNRWRNNWSGRGTAILDRIESDVRIKSSKDSFVPFNRKLELLKEKYLNNRFYASIYLQFDGGINLSEKQIQSINADYLLKI